MKFKGNFGELELSIDGHVATGIYQENGTLSGEYTDNNFKGVWHNKGLSGLIEFSIIDGKLDGRWKKGIEPGPMKSKWEGNMIITDKSEKIVIQNDSKNISSKEANMLKHGIHIYIDENGYIYDGKWINNEFINGTKKINDESIVYEGDFFNDKLIKGKKIITSKTNIKTIDSSLNIPIFLIGYRDNPNFDSFIIEAAQIMQVNNEVSKDILEQKLLIGSNRANRLIEQLTEIGDVIIEKTVVSSYEVFEGTFLFDELNGYGKYSDDKFNYYEGDFKEGKMHGKGKYTYADGDVYEGEFIDGKRTGKGKFTWANGDFYEGDFINDIRTGKGKYIWANGNFYEGDFIEGVRTGKGIYIWANGNIYEGEFIDAKRTGKGKYIWANGNIYEGDFIEGVCTGQGKFTFNDGRIEEGCFVDGELNGEGKISKTSGWIYKGTFKNGSLHGYGEKIFPDGTISKKGAFINGEFKETNEKVKSTIDSSSKNIVKNDKKKETDNKNEIRFFKVTYKIKLTQSKSKTELKGREFGMIGIILNGAKTEKIKTNDKGDLITREMTIKYTGLKIPVGVMKDKIETHDVDVKSGRAGTSTIKIIDVKEVNYAIGAV